MMLRKLENYTRRYGPVAGPKLYHALQSQAAHAGVSARLRRKLSALEHGEPWPSSRRTALPEFLPLFPDEGSAMSGESGVEACTVEHMAGATSVE